MGSALSSQPKASSESPKQLNLAFKGPSRDFGNESGWLLTEREVFHVLEQIINSNTPTYVREAASAIVSMLPKDVRGYVGNDPHLITVRDEFYNAARQIPHNHVGHMKLVYLLKALLRRPLMRKRTILLEPNITVATLLSSVSSMMWEKTYQLRAFMARLLAIGFDTGPTHAIWTLRLSLETEIKDVNAYSMHVAGAAMWMIYAAQTLYAQIVQIPEESIDQHKERIWSTGELNKDSNIVGRGRWLFWRNALADAGRRDGVDQLCVHLAQRAVEMMDVVDRNMTF